MKTTIKIILCISLVMSTALLTHADGDQGNGSKCGTCLSTTPMTMQTYEVQPVSPATNDQLNPVSTSTTVAGDDDSNAGLLSELSEWLLSLFG